VPSRPIFVLYGGTALVLRLAHRVSLDFALSYFQDGDLRELPAEIQKRLTRAAAEVQTVPHLPRASELIG